MVEVCPSFPYLILPRTNSVPRSSLVRWWSWVLHPHESVRERTRSDHLSSTNGLVCHPYVLAQKGLTRETSTSGSSSRSFMKLATSAVIVPKMHILCDTDQRMAKPPKIIMPQSDSDSELNRTNTRNLWIEGARLHPLPDRLSLFFGIRLDQTICS